MPCPSGTRAGNDDHRPRAAAQDPGERLVGVLSRSSENDHVTALGLAQDAGGGVADVLEHLKRDPGRVTARAKVSEEIRHPPLRLGQPASSRAFL